MRKIVIMLSVFVVILNSFAQNNVKSDYLLRYYPCDTCEYSGYKNISGEVVIEAKYHYATDTLHTIATVIDTLWRLYMIDRNGNEIEGLIPFCYSDFTPDNEVPSEGMFRFIENKKMGFADLTGKKIIAAQFDFVTPFSEGIATYFMGGGWTPIDERNEYHNWTGEYERGYIDRSGKKVPSPTDTDY
jgi:hypothetical protein